MEEKIYFINGISNDPCFNLASEEFLLKRRGERFIYVWQNAPSVIVGVNQNTAEEVNFAYTDANGIKVVRRQTGGGAVYHDLNNVCYTIIDSFSADRDNYRYFTEGVIGYLATLGVTAEFSGRNDISVCGKKISGNAQCVYKNRIMHHGTILFNTDKEVLENALKPHKFKIESKGV
ncbi:MAG: lipoate--protein ligase family protein, partial [Clostridia bacterium]|nr:lipoate--protein ligase family protein [Clostridia bacterium]